GQAGKVKATYRDGVLHVTLPKAEELKPREIKIDILSSLVTSEGASTRRGPRRPPPMPPPRQGWRRQSRRSKPQKGTQGHGEGDRDRFGDDELGRRRHGGWQSD